MRNDDLRGYSVQDFLRRVRPDRGTRFIGRTGSFASFANVREAILDIRAQGDSATHPLTVSVRVPLSANAFGTGTESVSVSVSAGASGRA
jgi:hypothetical protein